MNVINLMNKITDAFRQQNLRCFIEMSLPFRDGKLWGMENYVEVGMMLGKWCGVGTLGMKQYHCPYYK